jgi:hypothetical protein
MEVERPSYICELLLGLNEDDTYDNPSWRGAVATM